MEIWLALISLSLIHRLASESTNCLTKRSPMGSQQYTCTNVSSEYFEKNTIFTNRSSWFSCESCDLSKIKEATLNFSKHHILYMNLTKANINEIEDYSFKAMQFIKLLLLKNNLLKQLNDKSLYVLKRLTQLDLSANLIEALQDDIFLDLKELDVLNLNFNSINRFHPRAFNGLYNLKYLYLSGNDISYIQPYLFKYLTNLKILYLEHNKLKEVSELAFTNLLHLSFLYLNNNTIEVLYDYNFKQIPHLVDLQLRGNKLTEIVDSSFNGLRQLKFLYLGDNNVSIIEEHGFMGLDSLLILDLINNSLDSFSIEHFGCMPHLTTIWLESNNIATLATPTNAKIQENLQSFYLNMNMLSYFNYKIISNILPSLVEVFIGDNKWKCEFFVPMHDFFEEHNVSLCINNNCNSNDTIIYAEKLCRLGYNGTDGDVSSSQAFAHNLLLILVFSIYCCFNSSNLL